MRVFFGVPRLLTMIALTGLTCCAGEAKLQPDGKRVAGDAGAQGDAVTLDGSAQPNTDVVGVTPPSEAAADADVDAAISFEDCSKWSAWTCQEIPVMLCKATCTSSGKSYSLSCLKKGGCVCGYSTGLCGPYSYSKPCDACRQAFEKGCCAQ